MSFTVVDSMSLPSGSVNEDRVGAWGDRAWVIDGATDVVDAPLTRAATDASWFADEIHELLYDPQLEMIGDLGELPTSLAIMIARRFRHARTRPPVERFEHPSASGVVIRVDGRRLDYVSVGDCTLIVAQGGEGRSEGRGEGRSEGRGATMRLAADPGDAGDKALARAIAAFQAGQAAPTAEAARRHVWPEIKARRNRLNTPGGYGVWSISPPPPEFVRTGQIDLARGARVLLASDGLMRLVDVYGVLDIAGLMAAAERDGLASLGRELRRIEAADSHNIAYPRAKSLDDASGLLLSLD